MALAALGLWLGLALGARDFLTAAVVLPATRLVQWVDALPQHVLWAAAVMLGAVAGFVALSRLTPERPVSRDAPLSPARSARQALADDIRAAETSPTARRLVAARLDRIAALLGVPPDPELSQTAGPGYRTNLTRALDALERRVEGTPEGNDR